VGRFDWRQQSGALPEYPIQCCGFGAFTGFVARSRALPLLPLRGGVGQCVVRRDGPVIPGERLREGQIHAAEPGLGPHAEGGRPVTRGVTIQYIVSQYITIQKCNNMYRG
jgi:hypothetical protein